MRCRPRQLVINMESEPLYKDKRSTKSHEQTRNTICRGSEEYSRIKKNKDLPHLIALLIIVLTCIPVRSQSKPPIVYVDHGACPFECCTYRKWKAEKATVLYSRADKRAPRVGRIASGSSVVALTGFVRTRRGKFVITKRHDKYKAGDLLWVYTTLGEELYKVWFKGKMYEEKLDYMNGPFEQSVPSCEQAPACWGKLEKPLQVEWWVHIRTRAGRVGWTDQPEN